MEEISFIIRVTADEFDNIRKMYIEKTIPTQQQRERLETIVEFYEDDALLVDPSESFIASRSDSFYKNRPHLHAVDSVPSCYLCAREILTRKEK